MAAATDMHAACRAGNVAAVRRLLDATPEAASALDSRQQLPLHQAAYYGHEAVVRLLLEAAPEAATAADVEGCLPLHEAASRGHEEVASLLLEAAPQAAVAEDRYGRTPLQLALFAFEALQTSVARPLLCYGPAAAVLGALAAAGFWALRLFPTFLLGPGRLPLTAADWALVPSSCPAVERVLPTALACGSDQAAQVVRRMAPAYAARLRTAALCLGRCGLPGPVVALILAQLF